MLKFTYLFIAFSLDSRSTNFDGKQRFAVRRRDWSRLDGLNGDGELVADGPLRTAPMFLCPTFSYGGSSLFCRWRPFSPHYFATRSNHPQETFQALCLKKGSIAHRPSFVAPVLLVLLRPPCAKLRSLLPNPQSAIPKSRFIV